MDTHEMSLSEYVFCSRGKNFFSPRILKDLRYVPGYFKLEVPTGIKIYVFDILWVFSSPPVSERDCFLENKCYFMS